MVAIEKGQKASLCSGSSLDATEAQVIASTLDIPEVPKQFLDPERSAFPYRRELGRLEMSESQSGQIPILCREG